MTTLSTSIYMSVCPFVFWNEYIFLNQHDITVYGLTSHIVVALYSIDFAGAIEIQTDKQQPFMPIAKIMKSHYKGMCRKSRCILRFNSASGFCINLSICLIGHSNQNIVIVILNHMAQMCFHIPAYCVLLCTV